MEKRGRHITRERHGEYCAIKRKLNRRNMAMNNNDRAIPPQLLRLEAFFFNSAVCVYAAAEVSGRSSLC